MFIQKTLVSLSKITIHINSLRSLCNYHCSPLNCKNLFTKLRLNEPKQFSMSSSFDSKKKAIVIGGTNVDFTAVFATSHVKEDGATYPGTVRYNFGGVGRNIADCLTRLNANVQFISAIGNDNFGESIYHKCKHMNFNSILKSERNRTATYCAICKNNGEVINGIGDFDVHRTITPDYLKKFEKEFSEAGLVFIDGNIPVESIKYICETCKKVNTPVWFEPTDLNLAHKAVDCYLTYTSPNLDELRIMSSGRKPIGEFFGKDSIDEAASLGNDLLNRIPNIMVTMGKDGVLFCERDKNLFTKRKFTYFPVKECFKIQNVVGAGDCLAATFAYHNILLGKNINESMQLGLSAAQLSLQSVEAVPESVTFINLDKSVKFSLPQQIKITH